MNDYNSAGWLLGDEMKVETRTVTMMDTINQFIGRFEACRLNETDMNEIVGFGIYNELSELESIIHRISDKIHNVEDLNESEIIAMGVSGAIASAIAAISLSKPLLKAWAEDNILPKGLEGAGRTIKKAISHLTGEAKAKMKADIIKEFRRIGKLEGLSAAQIESMVAAEISRQKRVEALSKDRAHFNRELEKSRERTEYNSKRFPSKHGKG